MKKTAIIILPLFLIILMSAFSIVQYTADSVTGTWLTSNGKGKVYVYKENGKYYGKISWAKEPNNADGTTKTDKNNPDPKLRNQPIVGLKILRGFVFKGKNTWEDGKIYDPESGNDYSCIITLKNKNTLEVRGYVGFSMFGRTETWTRAE